MRATQNAHSLVRTARYDFYYDSSDRLLTEVAVASDGTETPEHNYYWLAGQPLAQERLDGMGGLLYIHNDFLGTPQRMSTTGGTVKWAARFSPFGEVGECDLNPAVDGQQPLADLPLRFPGQYDDRRKGIGYHYFNYHRYYDPATGRYIQPDPLGIQGKIRHLLYCYRARLIAA
jgi:RHS repeat-associated protein